MFHLCPNVRADTGRGSRQLAPSLYLLCTCFKSNPYGTCISKVAEVNIAVIIHSCDFVLLQLRYFC